MLMSSLSEISSNVNQIIPALESSTRQAVEGITLVLKERAIASQKAYLAC